MKNTTVDEVKDKFYSLIITGEQLPEPLVDEWLDTAIGEYELELGTELLLEEIEVEEDNSADNDTEDEITGEPSEEPEEPEGEEIEEELEEEGPEEEPEPEPEEETTEEETEGETDNEDETNTSKIIKIFTIRLSSSQKSLLGRYMQREFITRELSRFSKVTGIDSKDEKVSGLQATKITLRAELTFAETAIAELVAKLKELN